VNLISAQTTKQLLTNLLNVNKVKMCWVWLNTLPKCSTNVGVPSQTIRRHREIRKPIYYFVRQHGNKKESQIFPLIFSCRLLTHTVAALIRTSNWLGTWGPREIEVRLYVNRDWTVNRVASTWQNKRSLHTHTDYSQFEFGIPFPRIPRFALRRAVFLPETNDNIVSNQ
jgi:hypothetical protein